MIRHSAISTALLLVLVGLTSAVYAHAFHITVSEAEMNHKTGSLEISMRVHPGDLEVALGRMTGRRIRLEKEPNIDALITDYLRRSVKLQGAAKQAVDKAVKKRMASSQKDAVITKTQTDKSKKAGEADKATPKIRWVGKEISVKWAWLYFEIPSAGKLDGATLTNKVFHEILADQENTMLLTDGKRKQTMLFLKDKPSATIRFRTAAATADVPKSTNGTSSPRSSGAAQQP